MPSTSLKQRQKNVNSKAPTYKYKDEDKSKFHRPMPTEYFLGVLFLMVLVFTAVIIIEKQLPTGLRLTDQANNPNRFIAERAYNILKNLTSIGPRVTGSYENEVLAVNVLKDEIEKIISETNPIHIIESDIQKVSGAFNLDFLDGMTNVYEDVQNVIVKVGSSINSSHSLLINCHFDTVADSLGASDDGAGCAVMIEILRVLSKSDKILRHNVIFLFNGAEENFMPGSHGFITQHKWAKEIRTFINLEACGAGGREVLFQAGPNHPWILETYSEEVPYPYASSLAQEIFQSGVIPGDTDYRIFRDFGNISGLDFAWSANGYVYHTLFDSIEQIPLGSLQRTGDNILALAIGMAQGHQLSNVEQYREGNLVFFDFLGAFVIRWPMSVADVINILTVIISLYSIYNNSKEAELSDSLKKRQYNKKLLGCVLIVFVSWLFSVVASVGLAGILNGLGRTMSWYARPLWAFFLYVIPTILVSMATILLHAKLYHKDIELSPWLVFQIYYDAYQLIWTVVLFFGVLLRIRSSFIALSWVFFVCIGNILKSRLFGKWRNPKGWLLLHIGMVGLPFVQSFYLIMAALYLFIPIMGRAGAGSHAEFLIAVMMSTLFATLISFAVPLILLIKNVERIFSLLLGIFLISIAVLILTPLGFPYSGEPGSLAPQRFMLAHTKRTFHDETGTVVNTSSGYWIADMDINSPHTVDKYAPDMVNAQLVQEECKQFLYCGLPYFVPALTMIWKTHWLPGPVPHLPVPVNMTILNREKIAEGQRITLEITGPTHLGVMLSPSLGVDLKKWSIPTSPFSGPKWNERNTYFIYYAYGMDPIPFKFSLDFKTPPNHKGPLMDLVITSHYLFGPGKTTNALETLINQFPHWTAVTSWTASYESWII